MEWPRYSRRFDELLDSAEKYKAMKHEFPEDPEIVVISGSTKGLYEDEDWMKALVRKTREYIEQGVPVLGLCFGHQVIAKALGAQVVQMDSYEIGYRPIRMEESRIFRGLDEVEYPFSTHQDKVIGLPAELEVVARSDRCVQAIQHRQKPVYGVQFHIELTPDVKRKAIRTKDIDGDRKRELLREVNEPNLQRAKRTLGILENFLKIADEEVSPEKAGDREEKAA